MFKISLTQLEEARLDPKAFRKKYEGAKSSGRKKTIFPTLKWAIYKYHKDSSAHAAINYLEDGLASFKNRVACEKAIEDLQWYITEYQKLGWPTSLQKYNISIPLSTQYADSLKVTGEISRIDMHPNGAYAAWLFNKGNAGNWLNELRMPIIQNAVGVELGVIPTMVHVGTYFFKDHTVYIHNFTNKEIQRAHLELEGLFRKMGF